MQWLERQQREGTRVHRAAIALLLSSIVLPGPVTAQADRSLTPSYAVAGIRATKHLGTTAFFVDADNIGNVRQTQYDPLLTTTPSQELGWTTEVWAPLAGRVITAGVRLGM